MSKRYLWVVECKEGDKWVPLDHLVSSDEAKAYTVKEAMSVAYYSKKFRVAKYTPEEPT